MTLGFVDHFLSHPPFLFVLTKNVLGQKTCLEAIKPNFWSVGSFGSGSKTDHFWAIKSIKLLGLGDSFAYSVFCVYFTYTCTILQVMKVTATEALRPL